MTDESIKPEETQKEAPLSRIEREYWRGKHFNKLNYLCFTAGCFMVWQLVGAAFCTRFAQAVMSAYTSSWAGWSGFMLLVWIIGTIVFLYKGNKSMPEE